MRKQALKISVSPEELEEMRVAAVAAGLPTATWARVVLIRAAKDLVGQN